MRVIHAVAAISAEGSGPSYSVVRLCESLRDVGEDVTLAAMELSAAPSPPRFVRLFPIGRGPLRAGRSPQMCRWLRSEVARGSVDVLHSHSMWQMNSVYPAWAAKGQDTKLVVSPRGAFSRWAMAHGSRFKRLFWPLVQRPALAHASCFHTTAETDTTTSGAWVSGNLLHSSPTRLIYPRCDGRRSATQEHCCFWDAFTPSRESILFCMRGHE